MNLTGERFGGVRRLTLRRWRRYRVFPVRAPPLLPFPVKLPLVPFAPLACALACAPFVAAQSAAPLSDFGLTFLPDTTLNAASLAGWQTLGEATWQVADGAFMGRVDSGEEGFHFDFQR